jgi:hypothetical protein
MTNRKNYNSILFLTVYLGLVLVGGNAQVFAHAATNSLFDLRNEIEFKDDLDNKPDDACDVLKERTEEPERQFFEQYAGYISSFLKANYPPEVIDVNEISLIGSLLDESFPKPKPALEQALGDLKTDKDSFFGQFKFKSKLPATDLALIAFVYNKNLDFQRCISKNKPVKLIYDNTKVSSDNNQIFIVTRLPRASIDSLLK